MGNNQPPMATLDRDGGVKQANQAGQTVQEESQKVELGMIVEADQGDLGEEDITEAKVTDIVHDDKGNVESIVAQKGTFFKKQLEIPIERIQSVAKITGGNETVSSPKTVIISANEEEIEALTAVGPEAFPPENLTSPKYGDYLLDLAGEALPTDVGLRRHEKEAGPGRDTKATETNILQDRLKKGEEESPNAAVATEDKENIFQVLGPGLLSGMAGNDASAVVSYSLDGAQNGYGHLWLMLLSTPLLQAVQFACAKIGRVQQKGFAEIVREHYGREVAVPAALLLIVANIALIAADLVAISTGLELIIGLQWAWFAAPVAFILWYITVYQNFEAIKKIFLAMSMVFVAYF